MIEIARPIMERKTAAEQSDQEVSGPKQTGLSAWQLNDKLRFARALRGDRYAFVDVAGLVENRHKHPCLTLR
jgi:hypothetical protein